jgi:HAD superfamily hydrolase (TIGR01509 family)
MIKNIIFDLGNVLISFKPAEFLEKRNYAEKIQKTILNDIFHSPEWKMLDNGDINTNEAIEAISLKSSLKKEEIRLVFELRKELMYPLDENIKSLPALRERGFKLYYLSNFPKDIFEDVKNSYCFFKYFDGGCISAELKLSKPDVEIYKKLLSKYGLEPEESLFIDDIELNVRAAETIGMKGLCASDSQDFYEKIEFALSQY